MSFAALSTVIGVFENIVAFCMDQWGVSRRSAVAINAVLIIVLSVPCILGFNVWSGRAIPRHRRHSEPGRFHCVE